MLAKAWTPTTGELFQRWVGQPWPFLKTREALALDSPTLPHSLNYLANIWFESLFSNPLYLQEAS